MSSHLASSASAAVRSVFQTLDENKTGYIDRDIVRKFGQGFKPEWRPRDTARLMRAMDTDKDSRVGFTDFETFFRQILEQSFKRLDQRGTQTLTVEEVLIITSSFQESSEPLSVAKTQECRKCLGSNDVDMQLFVDYMLIETLGGHQPEEQKRALARLLGISSSSQQQKQQKGLEDSWRDTVARPELETMWVVKGERSVSPVGKVYEVMIDGEGSSNAPTNWAIAFHIDSSMIKQAAFSDALTEFGLSPGEIGIILSRVKMTKGFTGTFLTSGQDFGFDHTDGIRDTVVKKLAGGSFTPSSGSYTTVSVTGVEAALHADIKRITAASK